MGQGRGQSLQRGAGWGETQAPAEFECALTEAELGGGERGQTLGESPEMMCGPGLGG